jgi:hypothetical protein
LRGRQLLQCKNEFTHTQIGKIRDPLASPPKPEIPAAIRCEKGRGAFHSDACSRNCDRSRMECGTFQATKSTVVWIRRSLFRSYVGNCNRKQNQLRGCGIRHPKPCSLRWARRLRLCCRTRSSQYSRIERLSFEHCEQAKHHENSESRQDDSRLIEHPMPCEVNSYATWALRFAALVSKSSSMWCKRKMEVAVGLEPTILFLQTTASSASAINSSRIPQPSTPRLRLSAP